jgi:SPIRAL1-like protein
MSRGAMSSGGGRSSLGYLFEPEDTSPYHTAAKSNRETEKTTPDINSSSVKDDNKMIGVGAGAGQEPPQLPPHKREVSNPILSSNKSPCNIYHTSQLSNNNSGFLITVSNILPFHQIL